LDRGNNRTRFDNVPGKDHKDEKNSMINGTIIIRLY
jgi:hypothetical protein